ncbi:peptidase [Brenneria goodwinii]|uniref:Peptidase n=1 Tax=Brenneria goodwinii TaxID=1109412 RepID=A0AAE8EP48_9GAMM|nr:phage protease [Brenneria goodwinii]ATA26591.1 peptidase [Brenneria goodwinii]RLM25389.1 peptidase [Brenneria goodwinii]
MNPQLELLALCFELPRFDNDKLPEWLPVIPAGQFTGRDGRSWVNSNPANVIDASFVYPKLPIDKEHATELKGPKGDDAPAVGWIDTLRLRDDGSIDARIEWNNDGEALIRGKNYLYYSPAFYFTADGQVTSLSSVGLTNKPNLDLPALNSENTDMTIPVQLVTVLGLSATASVDDAVKAIQQIKTSEQVALNRAENPDLTKFIPVETHQLALNRATEAEGKLKAQAENEAEALVDLAIKEGKVAPANKEMYLATCRSEEGRKQFTEFVKVAPVIASGDQAKKPNPTKTNQELTDVELATCRAMGISKEQFLAAKANQEEQQ